MTILPLFHSRCNCVNCLKAFFLFTFFKTMHAMVPNVRFWKNQVKSLAFLWNWKIFDEMFSNICVAPLINRLVLFHRHKGVLSQNGSPYQKFMLKCKVMIRIKTDKKPQKKMSAGVCCMRIPGYLPSLSSGGCSSVVPKWFTVLFEEKEWVSSSKLKF